MAKEIGVEMVVMSKGEFERMKCCSNCDHQEVCVVVAQRKMKKADDYSPCGRWKLAEKKE